MTLGVSCECGKCLPVTENDAGSALTCSCGRRVVVPLLEEFNDRPLLLSAASLERRVRRLIAEGVLPSTAACFECGDSKSQVVNLELKCERSTVRTYGGQRFLIIPLLSGFLWASWREEERVEIRGRDTDVQTPVALCEPCHRGLCPPVQSWRLLLALLLIASGTLGYFNWITGIGLAVVGLALFALKRCLALRRWQRSLKVLLSRVPVYRQVLKRYPWAVVVVPIDVAQDPPPKRQ
jgi:hypothetical protein